MLVVVTDSDAMPAFERALVDTGRTLALLRGVRDGEHVADRTRIFTLPAAELS
jgi:hypothetical protein